MDAAADGETTPPKTQPTHITTPPKSLTFTNGNNNKRHPTTTTPPPAPAVVISYKECLKNHAASIGGHALDGCGEFMPSSSFNPTDPRSLKCAACGCHRNFHRREPHDTTTTKNTDTTTNNNNPTFISCIPPPQPPPQPLPLPHRAISHSTSPSQSTSPSHSPSPISSPSPPPLSHLPPSFHHTSAPHMLLALGNAYTPVVLPSSNDHQQQKNLNFSLSKAEINHPSGNKKRYRTKFSKEQKEKMHSFSEKLGWRMQKGDDGLVQKFCHEIGVSRGVFKVWMHNNKNLRKRSDVGGIGPQSDGNDGGEGEGGSGGFQSDINNPYNPNSSNSNNDIHIDEDNCVDVPVSMNGLSS